MFSIFDKFLDFLNIGLYVFPIILINVYLMYSSWIIINCSNLMIIYDLYGNLIQYHVMSN